VRMASPLLGEVERDTAATKEGGGADSDRRFTVDRRAVRVVQAVLDAIALVMSFGLAYLLRFDFQIPAASFLVARKQLLLVVGVQIATLLVFGVYRFIWRYVGMAEIRTFVAAAASSALPLLLLRLALPERFQTWRVPLSIIVMDTVFAFGSVLALRVARRALFEYREKRERADAIESPEDRKPALLVGAGRAGLLAAREIVGVGDVALEVKGFVDDDPTKQGSVIHGFPVLGRTEDLPRLVKEMGIAQVVITIARISRRDILRIIDICHKIPVKLRIIPGLYQIIQGKVQVSRIRNVQIEDLLGREPVELDEQQVDHFLAGRVVMVTGAGGSIGSELARQVARFKPAQLLLVERAEFALFEIDQELRRSFPQLALVPLVADVGEEPRIRRIFDAYRPHVVLHAAAHKHVPMMEANPAEAIKNNILATRTLGELSGQSGVEAFVMISTDKAVRPTSVMGASKRVAELVVQDLKRRYKTRFVAVRFGNVIGSAGSVVPIFREQIRRGGPVTVTHPDMRRYFMTIPEAAQLVLQAGAMGEGGEIFILDMGEPVRILDLAVAMITLTGLKPFEEMDIVFTGLRPGEKLYEELELFGEDIAKTRHPKIFIGKLGAYSAEDVERALARLGEFSRDGNNDETRRFLNSFLPEAKLSVRRETRDRSPRSEGAAATDKARPNV
jgi:FlaA1/EpsC-like NDP-sugar epimerase